MDEPDAVEEAIREMGVWLTRRYIHDPYPSETGTDLLAAIQQRYRNRRAGLSPTARTEIERVANEMCVARHDRSVTGEDGLPGVRFHGGTLAGGVVHMMGLEAALEYWANRLTSVLGSESTKETKE